MISLHTVVYALAAWVALSVAAAPFLGRWAKRIAEQYPEVHDEQPWGRT